MDADRHTEIRLAELLGAFCHALDLTEGQPQGHCIRVCWIGMRVGRELGLRGHEIWELYYTLLLKDLGCTSNAARICELYLTDDLSFKQAFKQIDGSLPQALRFVLSHTGMKVSMAERFRAIIKIFQNGGEIARELIETRCFRGADIARRMRFPEPVAQGILHLDEHWDGKGKPKGVAGKDIPLYAQVALLAQVVDVFHSSGGMEAACTEIRQRAGTWFDPELAATSSASRRSRISGRCWLTSFSTRSFSGSSPHSRLRSSTRIISTISRRPSRKSSTPRAPSPTVTASA